MITFRSARSVLPALLLFVAASLSTVRPSGLHAQEPRLRARLDPPTAMRVETIVDSARRMSLPTEPLVQKALEGESKGAPPDRIVSAVGSLLDALSLSRIGLGAGATGEELVAGALWIKAGGQADDLATLRQAAASPDRALVVPIAISADLVARGWPRAEAFASVKTLLVARLSDADFIALRDRVDQAVRSGSRLVPAVRAEVARLTNAQERRP